NQSEMNTMEDLRELVHKLEQKNLELINQRNQEMSHYEEEMMKLRLELERGEALRQGLEREMSFARREAQIQMYSVEDELCGLK
ncbi:CC171 protein, partial [Nicator chloris]|nr:CC171 protein [Nicator chloris]